jgi:putative hydrolase of the HAD superfamily
VAETIKAIIFDFGGVISHPQNEERKHEMNDILNIPYSDFISSYFRHRHQYDAGLITGKEYWKRICTVHAIEVKAIDILKLIKLDVKGWTRINTTMLAYVFLLQNTGIKTALLSNMTLDILTHIRAKYSWINDFHTCIFSCEHHIVKPDKKIYEICLETLDVDPSNCLFIDDTELNVHSARNLGIRAILFLNEQELSRKLLIHYKI